MLYNIQGVKLKMLQTIFLFLKLTKILKNQGIVEILTTFRRKN